MLIMTMDPKMVTLTMMDLTRAEPMRMPTPDHAHDDHADHSTTYDSGWSY